MGSGNYPVLQLFDPFLYTLLDTLLPCRQVYTQRRQQEDHDAHTNNHPETPFDYALSSNAAWAGYKSHQNPKFFPTMAQGQTPSIRKSSHLRFTDPALFGLPTVKQQS